jgi:hypothetical protein
MDSKPRRWKKEEKQRLVELWRISGKSKRVFSDEQGINYFTFLDWAAFRKRKSAPLARLVKPESSAKGFIPLVVEQTKTGAGFFAEVHFRGGHRICFHENIPVELFELLLK